MGNLSSFWGSLSVDVRAAPKEKGPKELKTKTKYV